MLLIRYVTILLPELCQRVQDTSQVGQSPGGPAQQSPAPAGCITPKQPIAGQPGTTGRPAPGQNVGQQAPQWGRFLTYLHVDAEICLSGPVVW